MKILNIKVPQNKQIFLSLSADKISSLLEENKKIFSKYPFAILNQPFMKMRENSREEVVRRALGFSKKIDPDITEKINPTYQYIIQTGHQPVFFHPGIWIKNIFLNELLKSPLLDKCLGINIILDNDTCKDLNFSLPTRSLTENWKLEEVNFLSPTLAPNLLFEEYPCPSLELITKFNRDITRRLKPLESENKNIINNFFISYYIANSPTSHSISFRKTISYKNIISYFWNLRHTKVIAPIIIYFLINLIRNYH